MRWHLLGQAPSIDLNASPQSSLAGKPAVASEIEAEFNVHIGQISADTLSCVAVLQLSELNVSSNNITGTLPSSWSSLEQVRTLCSQ